MTRKFLMRVGYIQPFRGHGLCGFLIGCMVTLGRTIMNSNHLAKHKVRTTEPHSTSCRLQGDEKKKLQQHGLVPLILRTSHTSLFRTSGVTHHPNWRKDTRNSTPDGCTRLQKKRNCVDIIIGHVRNRTSQALHHTIKRSVRQLTRKKQAIPPTTLPNKLLNNNSHETPTGKNAKNDDTICVQQIWTTIILPIILQSLKQLPPRTNLTDQPHNHHPRMFGHENSPCEWVTSISELWGFLIGCMVTLGRTIMNSNHLAKH